jgi:hypothetical protein
VSGERESSLAGPHGDPAATETWCQKLSMMKNDISFDFLKKQNYYFPCGCILDMKNIGMRLAEMISSGVRTMYNPQYVLKSPESLSGLQVPIS